MSRKINFELSVTDARTVIRALRIYDAVTRATELTQSNNDRIWREAERGRALLNALAKKVPTRS